MNTRKQVLVMVILLMIGLIGIAVYSAWDRGIGQGREAAAAEVLQDKTAERGALIFARNCRLCHGDVGEGGALGGRLASAPALNRSDLQGFVDSSAKLAKDVTAADTIVPTSDGSKFKKGVTILIDEERIAVKGVDGNNLTVTRGVGNTTADGHTSGTGSSGATIFLLDSAVLADKVKLITNTITCGRVGTPMPAWAQSQNGPLSDEQIRQLATLISGTLLDPLSRTPVGAPEVQWHLVKEEVDREDLISARLQRDIDESTISLPVTDVSFFAEKEALRIGEERMLITAVPKVDAKNKDKSGIVQVERGVQNSIPLPHASDEAIYKFPLTSEPSVLQQSCGQIARPVAPAAPPGEKACADPCQTVNLVAVGIAFDKKEINVKAGGNVRIHFTNNDAATQHNVAVYQSATTPTAVASGSIGTIFEGPNVVDDVVFAIPAPGTYFFRCDVHPTIMTGNFVVTP